MSCANSASKSHESESGQHAANPFVGPRPLQSGQAIYGRNRELRDLRNLLIAERIVVLYSPSGAGKTSLIQAGLIGKLQESGSRCSP